jgi:hypothetical protein
MWFVLVGFLVAVYLIEYSLVLVQPNGNSLLLFALSSSGQEIGIGLRKGPLSVAPRIRLDTLPSATITNERQCTVLFELILGQSLQQIKQKPLFWKQK